MFRNAFLDGTSVLTSRNFKTNFQQLTKMSIYTHFIFCLITNVRSSIVPFREVVQSGKLDTTRKSTPTLSTFLFFLFIYQRPVHIQPRAEVAQRGMKARHQFKKSTPLVVAGKKSGPKGWWAAPKSLPKRSPSARLVTCRISIL